MDKAIIGFIGGETPVWILFVVLVVTLLMNHKDILHTVNDLKASRFKKLENAINCDWVDNDNKEILKNELSELYIVEATGIRAPREIRDRLLYIYSQKKSGIRLEHFQRSAKVLKIDNGELKPSVGTLHRVWMYVEIGISLLLFLGVMFLIALSMSLWVTLDHQAVFEFPIAALLYLPLCALLFFDGLTVISLKHVLEEDKLTRNEDFKELKAAA
ncbi:MULTISPECIES: hypothetical protein [Vibrio]|uniref:DUF2721 domain-containing protein n=1 Tax=Vibrio kanaloae TaxID=170673 RepID=A0ABV4LD13_9VIBR|nr:hypothetical protein [Vibrio kanaloae]OEF15619.1 hypothetical protein A132_17340 [Vibrio kanaloae 5S-149]